MELFKVKDFFTDISMLEGVGGGGQQVDDPTIQTSVTSNNIFSYKTLSDLAILIF